MSVIDPPGGTFIYDHSFCSYFLTLILNSINVAIESPNLRSRIYEQRQRLKHEELKKLSNIFILGPIPDFTSDIDHVHHQIDMRPSTRSESFASTTTAATSDSASTTPGRTSPVSSKKKGFSRKIFGVFSGRSGSISSPSVPSNNVNNDGLPVNPQSTPDTTIRAIIPPNKESVQRTRSIVNLF
jgi:hypothetical protein